MKKTKRTVLIAILVICILAVVAVVILSIYNFRLRVQSPLPPTAMSAVEQMALRVDANLNFLNTMLGFLGVSSAIALGALGYISWQVDAHARSVCAATIEELKEGELRRWVAERESELLTNVEGLRAASDKTKQMSAETSRLLLIQTQRALSAITDLSIKGYEGLYAEALEEGRRGPTDTQAFSEELRAYAKQSLWLIGLYSSNEEDIVTVCDYIGACADEIVAAGRYLEFSENLEAARMAVRNNTVMISRLEDTRAQLSLAAATQKRTQPPPM